MPLHLLGPQRTQPNLPEALAHLGVDGPIVVISAGWRHDEGELDTLQAAVGPVISLPLYKWFEEFPDRAPELSRSYRERQNRIRSFKKLYRLRMSAGLDTVRTLVGLASQDSDLVEQQVESASEVVRGIDREALGSVDGVRAAYSQINERFDVPWIAERRDAARAAIEGAGAVLVAGGHVAVLRNRMLFFGVEHALSEALATTPVFAWSAGAMVMTERIVLFYDDAPDGPSDAEVLDHGLGFAPDLVVLPHARERLRLGDTARVAALARRFGPNACVGLEKGAWIRHTGDGWRSLGSPGSAFALQADGSVSDVEAE